MRLTFALLHLPPVAPLASVVLLCACSGGVSGRTAPDHPIATLATPPGTPLILTESQGEHRMRRPPPSNVTMLGAPFIIKVDGRNGGSPDFFMGYEDIPAGQGIPRHYHPHAAEILFVHRGTGLATLDDREAVVTAGTTIYMPPNTRVSLQNTGTEPLSLVFLFPDPDMGDYFRGQSVPEGQDAIPFSGEEFTAFRARHRDHIIFEPQSRIIPGPTRR
jgi:quercetin dioxygenase-like cupin family protein